MSSPTLSILPASESDLPILAEINRLAYFPEAIGQFMFLDWPNETTQHNFFLSRLWANFRNPKAQVLKVAHESGETIAFVCLTLNESARDEGSSVPSKSDAVSSSPPSPINARLAKYVFGEIDRLEGIMKGTAYFELSMLSVKPMHQRKGVATEILRYCLAQAEEAQLPIFLVSFPRPHDWYLRWGFEDLESFDTDLSEWGPRYCGFGIYRTYGMCRRPRPGAI